jgi:hypothetical protein
VTDLIDDNNMSSVWNGVIWLTGFGSLRFDSLDVDWAVLLSLGGRIVEMTVNVLVEACERTMA